MRTLRKTFSLPSMSGGFKMAVFRKKSNGEYKNKLQILVLVILQKECALRTWKKFAKWRKKC
jgi:hypothetical protein